MIQVLFGFRPAQFLLKVNNVSSYVLGGERKEKEAGMIY